MIKEILYDVEVPNARGRRYNELPFLADLNDFILSSHRTMCYKYDDEKEASRIRWSMASYCKNHKLPLTVVKRGTDIYVVKP